LTELLKGARARLPDPGAAHIYSSHPISTLGWTVMYEVEVKSLAVAEQSFEQYFAKPENVERFSKICGLAESSRGSIRVLE
jgi:hypothetical protein